MVIPWTGFPMKALIDKVEPATACKYVRFETFNPETLFPDEANGSLPWPYTEGLRLDEAMHPLTFMAFGSYGEQLPTQNGAPVRFLIPWKYGFKSGKAPVRIVFSEETAANHLEHFAVLRIRFLRQCQPASESSALEPGQRKSNRRLAVSATPRH